MRILSLVLAAAAAAPVAGQDAPRVVGGPVETRPLSGGLGAAVKAAGAGHDQPFWIGYAVPRTGRGEMCCYESACAGASGCAGCRLEGDRRSGVEVVEGKGSRPVALEPSNRLSVLLRVDGNEVRTVRAYSHECALDTGGRALVWLTGVRPADSLAYLESLTRQELPLGRRGDDGVVMALAHHDDPAADDALDRLASSTQPNARRKQAVFWMGQVRGRRGYDALRKWLASDAEDSFREHVVFALSESQVPESLDVIIETARNDRSRHVRGQALFWLSQKAGRKAAAAITDALRDDPDTEIKKKAVFALSQLPREEGIPLLIKTARTHPNPAVRKDAMFWLGQSNDPRALGFFEQILTR